MLVLTRKLMEKLFIGDDICVTVVRLEGGQVRLGIEAPREISVVRAELVPERLGPRFKPSPRTHADETRPELKHRPASAHGIDNRRRGRFR
jgi:carbon storage regulator